MPGKQSHQTCRNKKKETKRIVAFDYDVEEEKWGKKYEI
jgi:hypothetical protein